MAAYYNEIEPFAAKWLRNLIAAGHIAPGEVDERSIADVRGDDLRGFKQCHFFAGIGVWSYALGLAGWPDAREVWTGSCPCQPFSAIGKHGGEKDERHLWPVFYRLISERHPATVFGEQVAGRAGLEWLAGVRSDLERASYAVGAADLCAASVGAPHRRQRLYWVANPVSAGFQGLAGNGNEGKKPGWLNQESDRSVAETGEIDAQASCVDALHVLRRISLHDSRNTRQRVRVSSDRRVGGKEYRPIFDRFEQLPCSDGWRRIEPGTLPLAHGPASRVGRVRAYGNAIVAPQAAEFIRAAMECIP